MPPVRSRGTAGHRLVAGSGGVVGYQLWNSRVLPWRELGLLVGRVHLSLLRSRIARSSFLLSEVEEALSPFTLLFFNSKCGFGKGSWFLRGRLEAE